LEANPWGFFDMRRKVREWTADCYGTYPTGNPVIDPPGAASGSYRVTRGGSWFNTGTVLRSAKRDDRNPGSRNNDLGFGVGFQKQWWRHGRKDVRQGGWLVNQSSPPFGAIVPIVNCHADMIFDSDEEVFWNQRNHYHQKYHHLGDLRGTKMKTATWY